MPYTPEDRRAAASALREVCAERLRLWEDELPQRGDVLSDIEDCLPGDDNVFVELADLIDPTSPVELVDESSRISWDSDGLDIVPATRCCHSCGYPYGAYARFTFPETPGGVPRFCPSCGARQVFHGER